MTKKHLALAAVTFIATAAPSLAADIGAVIGQKIVPDANQSSPGYELALAGEWTKCIAWSNGRQYNIVYGQWSAQSCHELAIRCTGDANVRSTYYSSPVVIDAPYMRCTAR